MATGEIVQDEQAAAVTSGRTTPPRASSQRSPLMAVLEVVASLRLTVTLFALLIFLIFMGTLAQKDQGVWQVVEQTYFRVWFAWIDFQAFARLFELWTRSPIDNVPGGFWFPGGTLLGALLGINLLAAHSIRFRVNARGSRLVAGVAITAIGVGLAAALVIADQRGAVEGVFTAGVQSLLWHALRVSVAGVALFAGYLFAASTRAYLSPQRALAGGVALVVGAVAIWLYANPEVRLNPSGLRILWLLAVCMAVSAIGYVGCVLLFKKRSGVVLLHAGVMVLMLGELIVYTADEGQMLIPEGGSSNYAVDSRTSELAIVDASDPGHDVVTVVPQGYLANRGVVEAEGLPFKIKPLEFQLNSFLVPLNSGTKYPSTKGAGLGISAAGVKQVSGVDRKQRSDMPSLYAELLDPETDESLGVYLFSTAIDRENRGLNPQPVEVDGKTYQVALRMKRQYKPYSVELIDFSFDKFIGTSTAKNYSSDVIIHDDSRSVDRQAHISMNNPTRHAGDTLYQLSFDPSETATVLQVVTNTGRLIPYLACTMVGLGLFSHFGQTLLRFFDRRERELLPVGDRPEKKRGGSWRSPAALVPAVVAVLAAGYVLGKARPQDRGPGAMPVERFGALAMVEGGRVKPYDSYARTVLQKISERQEVGLSRLSESEVPACAKDKKKVTAVEWMLDVISGREGADDYRVFRITNLDVLNALGLEPRTGSFRYSLNEVNEKTAVVKPDDPANPEGGQTAPELSRQVDLAVQVPEEQRSLFQRQVLELASKVTQYRVMDGAYRSFDILNREEIPSGFATAVAQAAVSLRNAGAPLVVPPSGVEDTWKTVVDAEIQAFMQRRDGGAGEPPVVALDSAIAAYREQDLRAFSESLDELEAEYAKFEKQLNSPLNIEAVGALKPAERLSLAKARFEQSFNEFSPFSVAAALYVAAFVAAVLSWVVAPRVLGRTAMAIVAVTLALHTYAIVGRLYISGRPPVTNLYSSAVFIGWAMVVFGLLIDGVYRVRLGTALGAAAGFLTMIIAYFLGQDGDTFTVMQAVLDTQFWLATHVVCITLGYSATFMAGACGLAYLASRTPALFGFVLAAGLLTLRPLLHIGADETWGMAMIGAAAASIGLSLLVGSRPRQGDPVEVERLLERVTYGVLCFALFFSFIGTVLGGLWADDSWGRFWGWDPKENGAMIIVLWNALILHARWGRMITPRGFAALAVLGNVVTTWSWFGTNELGVGLHAYGGVSDEMSLGLAIMTTALVTHLPLLPLANCPRDAWRVWFGGSAAQS
ncbi:Cytochrome c biogenesis protein CcsA [Posidoniimonas polymericola]|uniref:Cytochrome c biogenesis protein CcsA n=1 Tax=Posidoniimonas polymericola TaxID=2528002 RepID=A0A5C5YM71_9BACT|nr:cytochrome c biogenesis protein CcsA [Posidoniimonas polymericola]TWT76014.1 Cytochrome c biogenesis protein CcsA [Posidoniimonas polymericola]